jgi:hypothetical protein
MVTGITVSVRLRKGYRRTVETGEKKERIERGRSFSC